MRLRHLRFVCLLGLIFVFVRPTLGEPSLASRVDPRVELLSIVFRLAGNSEYNMSPLKTYTADIDAYFSPYKEHPAVALARKLAGEREVGFDELVDLLHQYSSQRSHYRTFESFIPVVAQFYRSLAPRISEKIAGFSQRCVHVSGMQPFPNHSEDADPAIKELVITFDKALDPQAGPKHHGYSISLGPDGNEHFPISGAPEFLPGNLSIKLPVVLKPDWNHSFVLTPLAFASQDGYPKVIRSLSRPNAERGCGFRCLARCRSVC